MDELDEHTTVSLLFLLRKLARHSRAFDSPFPAPQISFFLNIFFAGKSNLCRGLQPAAPHSRSAEKRIPITTTTTGIGTPAAEMYILVVSSSSY